MLEALQQEEYKEERAHVRLMDDDEEDFVVHQADPGWISNFSARHLCVLVCTISK